MEAATEAARTYLEGARRQGLRRLYIHALISATAWNSKNEVAIWEGISKYSDDALWHKPYQWWNKVIEGHVRNRRTFMRGILRAKENWPKFWTAIREGDRPTIVKMKVGLGHKGASVLLRDSGHLVVPLDTHVLQSEFHLTPKQALKVQSRGKEYILYERKFLEKYGDQAPLMDLTILAREIGPEIVRDFARLAWRSK